jgi:hypothetical protein
MKLIVLKHVKLMPALVFIWNLILIYNLAVEKRIIPLLATHNFSCSSLTVVLRLVFGLFELSVPNVVKKTNTSILTLSKTVNQCLSYARDQWFPTPNLRNLNKKLSRQDNFSMRTLIFPSVQSLSDSVHYHQRDIFRKKLTKFDLWMSPAIEPWYPGVVFQWHHAYCWTGRHDVVATSM